MHLIKVFILIFFPLGQIKPIEPVINIHLSSLSADTIKFLKKKSETLFFEEKFEEVYKIFTFIADYYYKNDDLRRYFDYKNKAINCLCKFADTLRSLDTSYQLFVKYDSSNLNDTDLTSAIIHNIVSNNLKIQNYPTKLKYLDLITNSAKCKIPLVSQIQIAKNRIEITNKLSLIAEQINSYYLLLNLNLLLNDQIKFTIDLGNFYFDLKEYQLSNITLLNSLNYSNLTVSDKIMIYNILGNNYLHLKKYSLSFYCYCVSLELRQNYSTQSDYLRVIYNNLANYYSTIGNMDSARTLYRSAYEISKNKIGYNSRETAFQLNNLGNHYFNKEVYDSAFIYYKESFNIKQSIINYKDIDIIHSLYNLGQTQWKLGNTDQAIQLLKQSVIKNFELAKTNSLKRGLSSPNDYIISCNYLGEIYSNLFKQYHIHATLDSAKSYYERAIGINDSIIFSTPFETSKIIVNLSNNQVLENYLECLIKSESNGYYSIVDSLEIINLFDKSHNYVLLNKLIETDKDNRILKELSRDNTKKSIDNTYHALELLENDRSRSIGELLNLSSILFNKLKKLQTINYKNKQPYNWKNEGITYERLNQLLDDESVLLEYTKIKDSLYCLTIAKNKIYITKIGEVKEIRNKTLECSKNLRQFSLDFDELYTLSNSLLSPLKNISGATNKLIIIKDETLLSIPFDILLQTKPKKDSKLNNYLISSYDISYAYSINLFVRNSVKLLRQDNYDFLGFAPTTFFSDNYSFTEQLINSDREISNISKMFEDSYLNSLALSGPDATIESFYNLAGQTKILHIATHTAFNNNTLLDGFILYSSGSKESSKLITYYDIFNLTNSPNLVVLASCSSNSGKIIEGEGLQNIGRAFSIIGASFIISSINRLDDEYSYRFMSAFYKKLLDTKNIKNSLCNSKREFIKDSKYSYPTYWSNFNIIGK